MSNNGDEPDIRFEVSDEVVIATLQKRIEHEQNVLDTIDMERTRVLEMLRRYRRALALLGDEPEATLRGKPGPKPGAKSRVRAVPAGLSEERLEQLKQAILEFTRDHEQFRQVDIRTMPTLPSALNRSSIMAIGFRALREQDFIRFYKSEGNAKWFRLTHQAAVEAGYVVE